MKVAAGVFLFPHRAANGCSGLDLISCCLLQVKYQEEGKRSLSQSLYSQLPETSQTRFARDVSELQSHVRTCFLSSGTSTDLRLCTFDCAGGSVQQLCWLWF